MIPQQTFENYPVFGDNATKVKPGDAKYSAGFQQADVLPAEWMNWAWNKNSKGITDANQGLASVEAELNNVLSEANITPSESNNGQLFKAVQKNNGCIITLSSAPTTITNAPTIETGNVIKIMFGGDVTGADTTTALTISYNGTSRNVKVCKNGALENVYAHEVSTDSFKFIQAYTTLEFVFDGTNFVIVGNPVVLSDTDYTIYADGLKRVDDVEDGNMNYVTSNAVSNALANSHFIIDSYQRPIGSDGVCWTVNKRDLGYALIGWYITTSWTGGQLRTQKVFANTDDAVTEGILFTSTGTIPNNVRMICIYMKVE